ncbi:MAG: hypothetical protein HKN79_00045, partial [Flavobacteriales bacterium]|nr:hypothetical protein [Flavobacteriales bacterium]
MRSAFIIISFSSICSLSCLAQDTLLYIQGFVVEGNRKTKEWLITRECGFQVGDTLTSKRVDAVAREIQTNVVNLQLFASVDVLPVPLPDDQILFLITVTERWYLYPVPVIQLAEPNFNVWWKNRKDSRTNYGMKFRQYNFRGRNERLAVTVKFGWTREFAVGLSSPYLIKGKNWGFSVNAKYKENEEVNTGTIDNERIFFSGDDNRTRVEQNYSIGLGYRPDIFQNHTLALRFEDVHTADSLSILFPDYLERGRTRLQQFRASYAYSKVNVDRKGYPQRGYSYGLRVEKKGLGLMQNAADVLDIQGAVRRYIPLGDRWTTQHSVSGKMTLYNRLPYYLQQGLGYGNISVRSYEFYIIDGQNYVLSRNNLNYKLVQEKCVRFPSALDRMFPEVSFAAHLNLILDLGYVQDELYNEVNPLSNELLLGTGLGLDIVSNYDYVFRIEYTINRLEEQGLYLH